MIPESLKQLIESEVPKLPGWTSWERGVELAELIFSEAAKERSADLPLVFVEIGTFGGRACLPAALAFQQLKRGKAYTIDPWRSLPCLEGESAPNKEYWSKVPFEDIHQSFMETLWRLGLDDWLVPMRCASHQCHECFRWIDILLIDGCHSESASKRDTELYLPKVPPQGIVIMDDLRWCDQNGKRTTQAAAKMIEAAGQRIGGNEDYGVWRWKP